MSDEAAATNSAPNTTVTETAASDPTITTPTPATDSTTAPAVTERQIAEAAEHLDVDNLPDDLKGRLVRMKIDGQEVTIPLEKALKGTQRFKAATKKEMAAAAAQKKAEERIAAFLKAPGKHLSAADEETLEQTILDLIESPDPKLQRAADKAFKKLLRRQQMDPRDRDRESLAEERARLEADKKAWAEEQERIRQEKELAPTRARIEKEFRGALEAVGLPADAETMGRMVQLGLEVNSAGIEWSAKDLAEVVREEIESKLSYIRKLPPDRRKQILGDETVDEIRKAEVARVREKQAKAALKPATEHAPERKAPERPLTTDELRERWSGGRR